MRASDIDHFNGSLGTFETPEDSLELATQAQKHHKTH